MISNDLRPNYSADVRLYLAVGERLLPLAKIGPEQVVLREPAELGPCGADIVMTVDGREHRWRVFLVNGAVPFDTIVQTGRQL